MIESPDSSPEEENTQQIQYHFEDAHYQFKDELLLSNWIESTIVKEEEQLESLNFIFCSDNYLHKINLEYLNHDTLTDIITFPYSKEKIEGDIFISLDRITENAKQFKVSFEDELHRVMIHGVLHLCGFHDKSVEEKNLMTQKENEYLALLNGMILDI